MAQRLSALRQYATGELEELTLVGLEALLLEISSEPRPTEAEDLLYISVTKPIRTHLRKRRRLEESEVAEVAVEAVLAEEAVAEEAAVEEAGGEEAAAPVQEEAAAPVPKFGLAKDGSEKPAPMGADAFQEHLSKGAEMAPCSDKRKSAVFKKKNPKGLSSSPSEKTPKKMASCLRLPSSSSRTSTARSRPGICATCSATRASSCSSKWRRPCSRPSATASRPRSECSRGTGTCKSRATRSSSSSRPSFTTRSQPPGLMDKLTAIAAAAPALPPPLPPIPFVAPAPVLALARGGPGRAAAAANVHAQPPAPLPAAAAAAAPTLGPIMGYGDILARGDLQDVKVLKELVRMAVVPAHNYCSTKIFGECLQQVRRMEAAVSFNPLSVKANGIGVSDVDRLAERYRFFDLVRFARLADKMKEELPSYLAAVAMIRPLNERLDEDDKDTFDIEAWWSVHLGDLRAWADALCAVLCHVPNSCPPERAFSILNDSIGDDQTSALADYKKAMVMLQYNKRGR